ncbi:MAG TPA: hypothetical protein VHM01_13400 [Alphaproteobacteria bacterium]|nr:hypothetical protein [Alphaproteobacteria bacterium]
MTTAGFIAVYAIIATVVGMAYFAHRRWDAFFDRHTIHGEARETLMLHLMLGAAAIGAAWPVGIVFALYCSLQRRLQAAGEQSASRAPVL